MINDISYDFKGTYKGEWNGNLYAIAIFKQNSDSIEEFQNEIESMKKLKYKHIVELIGYCQPNEINPREPFVMIFERMEMNLESLIKSQYQLTIKEKVEMMLEISKGMQYAHSEGILHRDLKPSNILICKDQNQSKS